MENRAHALAAGIFTVLLALAVAAAVWWLSGKREATREYMLVTRQSVTGLNIQAQVRYRGIRAGKVLDIDLDPKDRRNIVVLVSVDADMPVTKSTTAKLNYQGVTGLAYVQLEDSDESSEPLQGEGGEPPRIALKGSAFDSLGDAALQMIVEVKKVAERTNRLLTDGNLQRIESALSNVEQASGSLSAALKDIPPLVASLRQTLNDTNLKRLDHILANLEKTSRDAAPLAAEMRTLVATLQGLGTRLDALSGEAGSEMVQGTLPRVNALLQELAASSRQLGRLLEQIEESPNMLVFGRGNRRPGPGEAGFSGQ